MVTLPADTTERELVAVLLAYAFHNLPAGEHISDLELEHAAVALTTADWPEGV